MLDGRRAQHRVGSRGRSLIAEPFGLNDCQRLYRLAEEFHPALKGCGESDSPLLISGGDNTEAIAALADWLRQSYPDAPEAFYRVRLWELICWQPVYLCVLFAEELKLSLAPGLIGYSLPPGDWGFRLQDDIGMAAIPSAALPSAALSSSALPSTALSSDELRALAAEQLGKIISSLYQEVCQYTGLGQSLALSLAADNLATALLRLKRNPAAYSHQTISLGPPAQPCSQEALEHSALTLSQACNRWLALLGWPAKMRFEQGSQGELKLQRQRCCLEYRLAHASKCQTCPLRQPQGVIQSASA